MTRPVRHTEPGQLCRIRPPKEPDAEERGARGADPDPTVHEINESVTVLTRFSGGQMDPLRFRWNNRVLDVVRVNGKWEEREGQHKLHYFAIVTKEGDFYELVYNTRTMGWTLVRTDTEG